MKESLQAGNQVVAGSFPDRIVIGTSGNDVFGQVSALFNKLVPAGRGSTTSEFISERFIAPPHPSDVQELTELLGHDENVVLFLFVESPEAVLSRGIQDGQTIADIAREWRAEADRLLCLAEKDDSRVHFFLSDAVIESPNRFAEHLSRLFDSTIEYSGSRIAPERPLWEDFHRLVAAQYIRDRSDLDHLASRARERNEFEPGRVNIDWSQALSPVQALREESAVLVDHLHRLHAQYETVVLNLQQEEDVVRDLRNKLSDLTNKFSEKDRQFEVSAQKLRETQKKLAERNRKVENMWRSTSWKITLPLRVIGRLFRKLLGR